MSSYNLSEDWQKITETVGYLHNTSQQNIEFVVVDTDVVPPKGSGKVLMPRNYHYFELPTGKEILVRVFRKMPSGYIPTISVNSTSDSMRREDNDLEGSTNCLTIGLSTWRQTAWYPLEWCVIARDALWQCIEAHEPSEEFLDDVNAGYWKCLTVEGTQVVGVSFTLDGKIRVQYGDGTHTDVAVLAGKAISDGNGNNIADTYMTKAEVTSALSQYTDTSDMNTALDNLESSLNGTIGQVQSDLDTLGGTVSQAQTALANLGNNAIVSATKNGDCVIRLTKGNGTNIDLTIGADTYVSGASLVNILADYPQIDQCIFDVTADATSIKKKRGNGEPTSILAIDTSLDSSSTNPIQNKAIQAALTSLESSLSSQISSVASRVSAVETTLSGMSGGGGGDHGCCGGSAG